MKRRDEIRLTSEERDAFLSVGIETQVKSPNLLRVDVPPHRHDLAREIDPAGVREALES